jgi:leucyl aminopeptidase
VNRIGWRPDIHHSPPEQKARTLVVSNQIARHFIRMHVNVTASPVSETEVDLLVVPVLGERIGLDLRATFGDAFSRALEDAAAEPTELVSFYPNARGIRRIVLVSAPDDGGDDHERLRTAGARGAEFARKIKASGVALALPEGESEEAVLPLVEGFILGAYRYTRYKTGKEKEHAGPDRLAIHVSPEADVDQAQAAADRAVARAEAVCMARDLVNLSPHEKTPEMLADATRQMGARFGFSVDVWNRNRIEQEKFGGLLAVNRGSQDPPAFIIMEHRPKKAVNERPVVLVGKAVVFDTGGLSLKPTKDSMDHMKADMSGGAAVIGAFTALARLDVPVHVIGLVPATDNRPGENAYVPGDVVEMHSGLTVEVLNTDAEGRMILADALSYARGYEPEIVIDIATLTGAQVIALGNRVAAVMTNEDDGADARLRAMQSAGRRTGDWVAPLPMLAHYGDLIKSDVADIKNVGGSGAGSITAGKFLERFTDYPWMHIDIAGPAFIDTPQPYRPKGGTGFGVRLLVDFLENRARKGDS